MKRLELISELAKTHKRTTDDCNVVLVTPDGKNYRVTAVVFIRAPEHGITGEIHILITEK